MLLAALHPLASNAHLTPSRVHLVDAYPRDNPRNFLFRGNNPVDKSNAKSFNFTGLVATMRAKALKECSTALPSGSNFTFYDLSLENPSDPGYFVEDFFWKAHPSLGMLGTMTAPGVWTTLGTLLVPKILGVATREQLIANGSWAIAGHADHLSARLNATRALLEDTSGPPRLLYAHCNAGCDRTGEFIGAYALSYLGYNITTAYGEACKQCGRCPNYYATNSIAWWCLTLQNQRERGRAAAAAAGGAPLGNCLDFAGCKLFGDCDAHGPTPLADACPR